MAEPIDLFQTAPEGHMPTARMANKDGTIGKLAKGHNNIATLIAQGWVILPDPVNRLLPEYRSACLVDLNPNTEPEPIEVKDIMPSYGGAMMGLPTATTKGGGKRKRIHR